MLLRRRDTADADEWNLRPTFVFKEKFLIDLFRLDNRRHEKTLR
jgi:hypothetical protein